MAFSKGCEFFRTSWAVLQNPVLYLFILKVFIATCLRVYNDIFLTIHWFKTGFWTYWKSYFKKSSDDIAFQKMTSAILGSLNLFMMMTLNPLLIFYVESISKNMIEVKSSMLLSPRFNIWTCVIRYNVYPKYSTDWDTAANRLAINRERIHHFSINERR